MINDPYRYGDSQVIFKLYIRINITHNYQKNLILNGAIESDDLQRDSG